MTSAYLTNLKFLIVLCGLINALTETSAAVSYISGPVCFGEHGSPAVISTSCHHGVIAITKVIHGAKHVSAECPDVFEDGVHDIRCCVRSEIDCVSDQELNLVQMFQGKCNGKPRCTVQTDRVHLTNNHCMDRKGYPNTTNYMYVEYNCINATNVGQNCLIDKSSDNGELFLVGMDFEGERSGRSGAGCSCSVESDRCDSTIDVITARRQITMEMATADCQADSLLSINGPENNQNIAWTCHNVITATTSSNYAKIHIGDIINGSGSQTNVWIGFKVSSPAMVLLACPARRQRFCTDTFTTETSVSSDEGNEWHAKKFLQHVGPVVGAVMIIAFLTLVVILICRNRNQPERPLSSTNRDSTPIGPVSPPPTFLEQPSVGTVSSFSCDSGFVLVTCLPHGIRQQDNPNMINQDYSHGRVGRIE